MRISVVMASLNGAKYIKAQIESICRQLAPDDELVVSDDGSADGTVEIVKRMQARYPVIRLIEGPGEGIFRNFENAILHAKGDIIFLADQDDVWKPDKVKTVMDAFRDADTLLVLHDADLLIGEEERAVRLLRPYGKGVMRNLLRSSYWGCCMAFRRAFLAPYLPFRRTGAAHDQLIGLLSERTGGTVYLPEVLLAHRIHGQNKTRKLGLIGAVRFRIRLLFDYVSALRDGKRNR